MLVSVVIPVKDDAGPLAECLRLLAGQTRRPDEIVVVDNGSSDDGAAVARRFGARVVEEPRPGIPAANGTGFDAATGDIIARCDADSRPPADWLERIVAGLEHADAVTGPGRIYDTVPGPLRRPVSWLYGAAYTAACALALGHPPLFGSNCAVRAEAWRAVSDSVCRDDTELHDDLDVSVHLGRRFRITRDRRLVVGISGRPFAPGNGYALRLRRGWRSIVSHWPEELPPYRWDARRRARSPRQ